MFILSNQRDSNLWIHVVEDTEHPSLVRTRWDVTKVVGPLDFFVPESVWEPKSDLCQRKKENISTQIRKQPLTEKDFSKTPVMTFSMIPAPRLWIAFCFLSGSGGWN